MPEAYASPIDRLRALSGTARDPEGHVFAVIAEYLRRDGKLDEAKEVVERGREANPDFASGHVVAVQVLTELGDLEAALDALRRLHELDAANTRASGLRQALVAAEEKSAVDWARAQGVGPSVQVDPEVVTVTLGELYLDQGEPEKAASVARQLLRANPSHEAAQRLLAKAEGQPRAELSDSAVKAPEVVAEAAPLDVAELAPSPVPIEELGPDPVPIASLAPEVVAIASLAPTPIPVAELAPQDPPKAASPVDDSGTGQGESAPGTDGAAEGDLDDFMSWLDER